VRGDRQVAIGLLQMHTLQHVIFPRSFNRSIAARVRTVISILEIHSHIDSRTVAVGRDWEKLCEERLKASGL
jgi:hypothetical protein